MTSDVGPASHIRGAGLGLVLGMALLLPLAGCVSSGASSFSEDALGTADPIRSDDLLEIPLDVAGADTSDMRDTGSSPAGLAAIQLEELRDSDEEGPVDTLKTSSLMPDDLIRDGTVPPEVLSSKEVMELRQQTEARLASIIPTSSPRAIDGTLTDIFGAEPDPAELAAEQRIPALFASIDHGQCLDGWGPKPKRVNARRVDPAHKYYMEMRMRHTPLLPVGHVYIAYGRLDAYGKPVDEKLTMLSPLGGYVGAGIASTLPMPGILKPIGSDCTVRPEAAYRLSLSAQDYEKLLLAIKEQHKKKPAYHLFAYNCNHYLSEVATSVGILPPENIYQPSLTYLYALMDRNEGYKVPRTPAFDVAAWYPSR